MNKRKLPPYSRELQTKIRRGYRLKNDLFICLGRNGWGLASSHNKTGNSALVLPDECSPKDFNWSVANNQDVLIVATDSHLYQLVRELAYELLTQGKAKIVRAASITGGYSSISS